MPIIIISGILSKEGCQNIALRLLSLVVLYHFVILYDNLIAFYDFNKLDKLNPYNLIEEITKNNIYI